MKLETLSATAADTYENCPARYRAHYSGERPPETSSAPADLGSVVHATLEAGVKNGVPVSLTDLKDLYGTTYWTYFADRDRYNDGLKMIKTWHDRQNWKGREVLMVEVKETFDLPYAVNLAGEVLKVPVTYIWDRCDRLDNGDIEVVDYKTWVRPAQPEDLKYKIQPRVYSLAARKKFPDAPRIWVTYDQLRYDEVSTVFTKEDDTTTYKYLQSLALRIHTDDDPKEKIGNDCRWCVRRDVCKALRKHVAVGGPLSLTSIEEAARLRDEASNAIAGLQSVVKDADEYLLAEMVAQDKVELEAGDMHVKLTTRKNRNVDFERAADVIGDMLMKKYGKLTLAALDELLKGDDLTDAEKTELQGLIYTTYSPPTVVTKPAAPHSGF